MIADAAGVQSMAGVIGGEATGCDEATRTVFIECALFDPVRVALTGRRHQVTSDARQRFERGIDPALMPAAIEAATRLILDLCGGAASEIVSAGAEPHWQRNASLRFARLAGLGGLDVPADEAVASLERLGFTVAARDAGRVTVNVPSWRNDIAAATPLDPAPGLDLAAVAAGRALAEPEADLVEEVLRLRGLDAVPPVSMSVPGPVPQPTLTPRQARTALARRVLAARGLVECVTFSFMASAQAALFGSRRPGAAAGQPDRRRPRPAPPHSGRDPGAGGPAQRRARLAGPGAVRGRPCVPRGSTRGATRVLPQGCGRVQPRGAGLHQPARATLLTQKRMCGRRWRRSACRWRR